jgi:hypothetical protein
MSNALAEAERMEMAPQSESLGTGLQEIQEKPEDQEEDQKSPKNEELNIPDLNTKEEQMEIKNGIF